MIKKVMVLLLLVNCGREEHSQRPVEVKSERTPNPPKPAYFIICPSIQLLTFDPYGTYSGGSEKGAVQTGLFEVKVGGKKLYFSNSERWILIDFNELNIEKATESCEQI